MKIGIDIRPLQHIMTGVGRYLSQMLYALAANDKTNEYILFFNSFKKGHPEAIPSNGNFKNAFYRLPNKALTVLWAYVPFPKIEHFLGDIDVIHSANIQMPPAKRALSVLTIHDLIPVIYPEMSIPSAAVHFKPRIKYYSKRADIIVADSNATAAHVVEYLDVPAEKVVTVYPGTVPFAKASQDEIREMKNGWGSTAIIFFM